MKTITNTSKLQFVVTKDDLIYDEWIPFEHLSNKLAELEKSEKTEHKFYRQRLYNAIKCGKINYKVFAGIRCINVLEPMKIRPAQIELDFVRDL